mmetsp:Transcript_19861/g.50535  ORF Transcript_19861/g.50535 Transcript_19861/m.50535 type:complete len:243 (+) Transcript_19861:203-931(+)
MCHCPRRARFRRAALRGLEPNEAEPPVAEIAQHHRLRANEVAPAPLPRHALQKLLGALLLEAVAVALLEDAGEYVPRLGGAQLLDQRQRDGARIVRSCADVVADGEHVGGALPHLLGGNDTGRVEQEQVGLVAARRGAPLRLLAADLPPRELARDARAIFRLHPRAADQPVDQRGLAHVGEAEDARADGPRQEALGHALLVHPLAGQHDRASQRVDPLALLGVDPVGHRARGGQVACPVLRN